MTSAPTDCRVPDPTDAKADGNFGNHRAGYGDGRLQRITHAARQGWTLAAGEGAALVEEIDNLRKELDAALDHLAFRTDENETLSKEIDRLRDELVQQSFTLSAEHQQVERVLDELREPSEAVWEAASEALNARDGTMYEAIRAAVRAAGIGINADDEDRDSYRQTREATQAYIKKEARKNMDKVVGNLGNGVTTIVAEMDRMRKEIARYQKVMHALREPSEAVMVAMGRSDSFDGDVSDERMIAMLRAAVEAAEQEVGG